MNFHATVLASSDVPGRGTVVVVEVGAGAVAIGATVVVAGAQASVTAVEAFAQDEEEIAEGVLPRVGLLLDGVLAADVPRGTQLRSG